MIKKVTAKTRTNAKSKPTVKNKRPERSQT